MEELRNYTNDELEENKATEQDDASVPVEETENGSFVKVIGGLGVVGGIIGFAIYAWKNRDNIKEDFDEKRARKLEKRGYTVYRPGVVIETQEVEVDEEEDSEEATE